MNQFIPNKTRLKKFRKGRNKHLATRCNRLAFGQYGIQAVDHGIVNSNHLESVRRVFTNYFRRNLTLHIRVFPHLSKTKKPIEVRLGRGKGGIECWYTHIKPGTILFELGGITNVEDAKNTVRIAGSKLPFKTRFVQNIIN